MKKLLNFTKTQERKKDGVSVLEWRRGRVYIVMVEKIWIECHLMRVNKWSLNVEISKSDKQTKFGFPVATLTSWRAKFKKIISYSILIGIVSFWYLNWSPGCLVSGKINLIHIQNILRDINEMVSRCHLLENNFNTININMS